MNLNISGTSGLILIKFYQKHLWGGGKATSRFGADLFRTLVSMATDRDIMRSKDYTCWLSGEGSLPFWLLVCFCFILGTSN